MDSPQDPDQQQPPEPTPEAVGTARRLIRWLFFTSNKYTMGIAVIVGLVIGIWFVARMMYPPHPPQPTTALSNAALLEYAESTRRQAPTSQPTPTQATALATAPTDGYSHLRQAPTELEDKLISAGANGDIDAVRILVSAGVNPNAEDQHGRTPLMWAAESGSTDIVKYLLSKGADVNQQNNEGDTALSWASGEEHTSEVIKVLLRAGANINLKDQRGDTAIDYAILRENQPAIALLRRAGAKPTRKSRE